MRPIRQSLLKLPTRIGEGDHQNPIISGNWVNGISLAYVGVVLREGGYKVTEMMPMNTFPTLDRGLDQDLFESVTEEEIIHLWRSIKGRGLSEDEAWQAVVTGIALDMAFAKSRTCNQIEH